MKPRFFDDAAAFGAWLERHAASETELVVGFHKVATGTPCMSWSESVDEALCHGWIDGVRKRIDDETYQIRFTPRKPGSIWSAINIAKVEKLTAQQRMRPAGVAAYAQRIEARSGIYSYERTDEAVLTPAEAKSFKAHKAAWRYFESAPPGYRHQMLHRIVAAKRPQTRAKRLALLIDASARGERLD